MNFLEFMNMTQMKTQKKTHVNILTVPSNYIRLLFKEITMALTSKEKARAFKAKMYAAGYKQKQIWVPRQLGEKNGKITRNDFIRKLDELTADLSNKKQSDLFKELIRIIEQNRRKEAAGKK